MPNTYTTPSILLATYLKTRSDIVYEGAEEKVIDGRKSVIFSFSPVDKARSALSDFNSYKKDSSARTLLETYKSMRNVIFEIKDKNS